jgi:hypothetical protein
MRRYYRHVRRRPPRLAASLSCLVVCALAARPARAQARPASTQAPVRVGLADVTTTEAGHAAVAALRARLEPRAGISLPRDAARAALEEPLYGAGEGGAPTTHPRALQLIRAARDAYSRFDYDGALERLRQAELDVATAAPAPDVTSLLVEVNLLAGVVEADRGNTALALESFRVVQRLDPARKALDPGSYRPRVVALYAQAAAAPTARSARLAVVTDPAGALIWIDGRRVGFAPLSESLEAGVHYVAAVGEGSVPRLERPVLRPGEDNRLSLLLALASPEERARRARADLVSDRRALGEAAQDIADYTSVDVLVVVRDPPKGVAAGPKAAIYDARRHLMGPFMPASPPEPVLVALDAALARPKLPEETTLPGPGRDRPPLAATPWYRSWWLAPTLLGVGAAATLGTLWIIDRERTTTYAINRWCFGNTCAP